MEIIQNPFEMGMQASQFIYKGLQHLNQTKQIKLFFQKITCEENKRFDLVDHLKQTKGVGSMVMESLDDNQRYVSLWATEKLIQQRPEFTITTYTEKDLSAENT